MAARSHRSVSLIRSLRNAAELRQAGPGAAQSPALARHFAAAPGAAQDDVVKSVFINQQRKFRAILEELARVKINIDPKDDRAVKDYHSAIKQIRQKLGIPSYTEKVGDLLDSAAEDAPDVRSFFLLERALRTEMSLPQVAGYDAGIIQALNRVEKKIGKPLMRDDAKGVSLLKEELDSLNAKLGLNPDGLEELEAELEFQIAKGELSQMKKEAEGQMDTFRKRDSLEGIKVDVKSLDPRPYL